MTNDPNDPIDNALDFGDDDGAELPADPQFDAWLTRAAPHVHAPTATPRLEMWTAIRASQRTNSSAQPDVTGVRPLRRTRWFLPAAIAAAMLAGVAVDRLVITTADTARVAGKLATPAPAAPADPSKLYQLAAEQTLTQAEALLTAYRASDVATRNPASAQQLGTWGRDILSSTRLLIDSPAGDDPRLRALLGDLELVLVQIINLSGTPLDADDRSLIDGALRDRDLIPRIRTAVPAGTSSAASDD